MSEDLKTEELDLRTQSVSKSDPLPQARAQRVSLLQTDDYIAVSPHTPLAAAITAMRNAASAAFALGRSRLMQRMASSPDRAVGPAARA